MRARRLPMAEWTFLAVLALACAVLAILQFRWTGQITTAERDRARAQLRDRLESVRGDLNAEIFHSLQRWDAPGSDEIPGRPWLVDSSEFVERGGGLGSWFELDSFGRPVPAVPPEGSSAGNFFEAPPPGEIGYVNGFVIRDAGGPGHRVPPVPGLPPVRRFQIAALDTSCLRNQVMPQLIERYFGQLAQSDYEISIVDGSTGHAIYQSSASAAGITVRNADAHLPVFGPPREGPPGPGRPDGFRGGPPPGRFFDPPPERTSGLVLLARHKSGSLEAMVARERVRNLAVSGAMLLLILATGAALVRFTRASGRISELRMNIAAGVSHELRSPLAVIRTAAFNLQRAGFSNHPDQVRRYGELIGAESSRLERLIENVLQFAAGSSPRQTRRRVTTDMAAVISSELEYLGGVIEGAQITVERNLDPSMPVAADTEAIRHAIRNVLENAIKYGREGGWIGVSAKAIDDAIEIRIRDHGAGIPASERSRIFEPFFRGERAIEEQRRGTGLGLSLADQIIRAHGGSITVDEEYRGGAEFIIRLPAAREAVLST